MSKSDLVNSNFDDEEKAVKTASSSKKKHLCPHCGRGLKTEAGLRSHIRDTNCGVMVLQALKTANTPIPTISKPTWLEVGQTLIRWIAGYYIVVHGLGYLCGSG